MNCTIDRSRLLCNLRSLTYAIPLWTAAALLCGRPHSFSFVYRVLFQGATAEQPLVHYRPV